MPILEKQVFHFAFFFWEAIVVHLPCSKASAIFCLFVSSTANLSSTKSQTISSVRYHSSVK